VMPPASGCNMQQHMMPHSAAPTHYWCFDTGPTLQYEQMPRHSWVTFSLVLARVPLPPHLCSSLQACASSSVVSAPPSCYSLQEAPSSQVCFKPAHATRSKGSSS
jgi:hypothetical protein